jgi:UDP-glucuronate 4-epimerase
MNILVTGAAGFIGYHVSARLLDAGEQVTGVDNLNPYYDPRLKQARLDRLLPRPGFGFVNLNIAERASMARLVEDRPPDLIIHLAAQVGVRYSMENPHAYLDSNLTGFLNVLEGARRARVRHLIYASSSSVYGSQAKTPFATGDRADTPVSFYAATKRANELMAHCYSHLYGLPTTGLRFFTVYGPWGRPDMAPFRFTRAMLRGEAIELYNHGQSLRDFTYVDDVVESVYRVALRQPEGYRLFNIGNSQPVSVLDFVAALENTIGFSARKRFLPAQPGDLPSTWADVGDFRAFAGFSPGTPLSVGVGRLVTWYRGFYGAGEHAHAASGGFPASQAS